MRCPVRAERRGNRRGLLPAFWRLRIQSGVGLFLPNKVIFVSTIDIRLLSELEVSARLAECRLTRSASPSNIAFGRPFVRFVKMAFFF